MIRIGAIACSDRLSSWFFMSSGKSKTVCNYIC